MELLQSLSGFFSKFESKDWVTLVASTCAFAVSVLSYRQKTNEGKLALRKQLTEILEKLTELNIEAGRHRTKPAEYPSNYGGLLNDKRRFLVRQANFLIEKVAGMVTPYEYLLVAGAYDDINDAFQAESYFGRAMHSSQSAIDKGIAMRSYARYLFAKGPIRHSDARRYYEQAAALFTEPNDRYRVYLGDTYVRWGSNERDWRNLAQSEELFLKATTVFETLENPLRREQELTQIAILINEVREQLGTSNVTSAA